MLLDEVLALARRLPVLFDAVAKLEEAFVSRRLGLGAGTAAVFAERFQIVSLPYRQAHHHERSSTHGLMPSGFSSVTNLLFFCTSAMMGRYRSAAEHAKRDWTDWTILYRCRETGIDG